jgi:hypothetical protein
MLAKSTHYRFWSVEEPFTGSNMTRRPTAHLSELAHCKIVLGAHVKGCHVERSNLDFFSCTGKSGGNSQARTFFLKRGFSFGCGGCGDAASAIA